MEICVNHPERKALSICHGCGKHFCESCLTEGEEFYYCKSAACQELLKRERKAAPLPARVDCPVCSSELGLSEEDRTSRKYHCPECNAFVDFTADPPKIFDAKNYCLLFTTMNQSDIAVIKSLLDNANIDYYVYDEDFLAVRPLVQPARFFVDESETEEAKEILKSLDLNLFGISSRNKIEK
jgi:hypothetical protein